MQTRLVLISLAAALTALLMVSGAQAQTTCKTVEGPGSFAQACGTNPQVSVGPSGSSASTGPVETVQIVPSPAPTLLSTPAVTPTDTFTPVATVSPTPVGVASTPAPRPAPQGLIGALLRLLGLG